MNELVDFWYSLPQDEFNKKLDEYAEFVSRPESDVWCELLNIVDPDGRLDET